MPTSYETAAPIEIDESIDHLSKTSLATALEISIRTLNQDLTRLKRLMPSNSELDHQRNERGCPINTAKYLILFRYLVSKKEMSRDRASKTIAEQSWRGIDYLIEQRLANSPAQPIYDLINQLLRRQDQ